MVTPLLLFVPLFPAGLTTAFMRLTKVRRVSYSPQMSSASLSSLERRLGLLEVAATAKLKGFYVPALESFAVETGVPRFAVTSTCYAVDALSESLVSSRALLECDWRNGDLFQLPLIVYAVASIVTETGEIVNDAGLARLHEATCTLITSRARLSDNWRQSLSCYLQYWLAAALIKVADDEPLFSAMGVEREAAALALARAHEVARNELCRQIAFHASGDRTWFDVTRLAYSLLTYALVGERRDRVMALSDKTDPPISVPNEKLCMKALEAFFDEQGPDGLWPAGEAIYARSRRSFDVGNAFVFSPDVVGTLFRVLPATYFEPHLARISKLTTWLEDHQLPDGWRSNHLSSDESSQVAVAWSTAQTLKCASAGRRVAQRLLNADILEEFRGLAMTRKDRSLWDSLLDSDLAVGSPTLKQVIEERVLEPRFEPRVGVPTAWSAVLFGPPGTAKTTTAEAVAQALGYDWLVIDTAVFLEDGLSNVAARMAYVFSRLKRLQKCVILFDEIEEFCLDRNDAKLTMESRMLTTAMLTQLNDLRRARRSVFFVATNRLADFDSAITRPGRIDMLLYVGTPRRSERVERFRLKIKEACDNDQERDQVVAQFDQFLQRSWETDVRYMNFLESERFADAAATSFKTHRNLEQLSQILDQQRAVMLIRDPETRADVDKSQTLTRL